MHLDCYNEQDVQMIQLINLIALLITDFYADKTVVNIRKGRETWIKGVDKLSK